MPLLLQKEIIDALDKICQSLPDTLKAECEMFVNQYGPTVIALLLQELDPEQVCTKLGLCSGTQAVVKTKSKVGPSTQCVLCEFIVTQLDQLLEENATQVSSQRVWGWKMVCWVRVCRKGMGWSGFYGSPIG